MAGRAEGADARAGQLGRAAELLAHGRRLLPDAVALVPLEAAATELCELAAKGARPPPRRGARAALAENALGAACVTRPQHQPCQSADQQAHAAASGRRRSPLNLHSRGRGPAPLRRGRRAQAAARGRRRWASGRRWTPPGACGGWPPRRAPPPLPFLLRPLRRRCSRCARRWRPCCAACRRESGTWPQPRCWLSARRRRPAWRGPRRWSLRKRSSSRRGPPLLSVWRTVNGDFRACWLACRSCVGGRVGSGRGAAAGTPRLLLSRL